MSDKRKTVNANGNGWPGDETNRRNAVVNFLSALKADSTGQLKKQCCDPNDPNDTAKKTFLAAGGYTNVPSDVLVRVFDLEDEEAGDKLVTLVLPKDMEYDPDTLDKNDVWVCTYVLWNPTPGPTPPGEHAKPA